MDAFVGLAYSDGVVLSNPSTGGTVCEVLPRPNAGQASVYYSCDGNPRNIPVPVEARSKAWELSNFNGKDAWKQSSTGKVLYTDGTLAWPANTTQWEQGAASTPVTSGASSSGSTVGPVDFALMQLQAFLNTGVLNKQPQASAVAPQAPQVQQVSKPASSGGALFPSYTASVAVPTPSRAQQTQLYKVSTSNIPWTPLIAVLGLAGVAAFLFMRER